MIWAGPGKSDSEGRFRHIPHHSFKTPCRATDSLCRKSLELGYAMSASAPGDCVDIVRCLALFLRDQRDALEIVAAATNSIADRLQNSIVRIWISRPSRQCGNCLDPDVCVNEFHCLRLETSAGMDTAREDSMSRLPFGHTLPGIVGKTEEEYFCPDLRGFGLDMEREWARSQGVKTFCGFPLRSAGRLLGVLGIYLKDKPPEEGRRNLSTAAMILSQALGSAFLRSEQERLARELEDKVQRRTAQLKARVVDLEDTRRAMLNMMSEAFEAQRQMRELTEKLEIMVQDRTRELLAAKEEAERANKMKSQFLSRVSHELRTPMHGMISFANLGIRRIDQMDRDKTLFYFQQILESAGELLPLIDDLLDISRIEAGKVDYSFQYMDLRELVFDIAQKYRPLFDERSLALLVQVDDDFPKAVRFDRKHLRQALVNLLGNAGKFGKPGTEVSVHLACEDDEIRIRIADRGPGIPEEELGMVFESFSQSTATRGCFEGAGLGLAITQAIVHSHDGSISVRNRDGGGAEFLVVLPHDPEEAEKVSRKMRYQNSAKKADQRPRAEN